MILWSFFDFEDPNFKKFKAFENSKNLLQREEQGSCQFKYFAESNKNAKGLMRTFREPELRN